MPSNNSLAGKYDVAGLQGHELDCQKRVEPSRGVEKNLVLELEQYAVHNRGRMV